MMPNSLATNTHPIPPHQVPCYLRGLTAERIVERCAEELRPHVALFDHGLWRWKGFHEGPIRCKFGCGVSMV